jgi:streptogramin lyase
MIPRRLLSHVFIRAAVALTLLPALLTGPGVTAAAVPDPKRPDPFPAETGPIRPDDRRIGIAAEDPVRDLGAPISSLTIMEGAVGRTPDGRDVVYAVPAGENAQLNIVDLHSRQRLAALPLAGAAGAWAIVVVPDGRVYVGTYPNAHLYRYDPATGTVTDLGQPIPGEAVIYGLTADQSGNVYAGTYPTAHAFKYDAATGQVTDYGSLDPVQQYARSTVYDPDHNKLFVGVSTPNARLLRIDVETRVVEDITPPGTTAKDFIDLDYVAGRVFANASSRLVVVDAVTGEQVKFTDTVTGTQVMDYPIAARGVSAAGPGGVYFTTNALSLTRYNLDTNTVGPVSPPRTVTRGGSIGYGWVTENGSQVLYGLAGNYSGGTFRYNPQDGTLAQWSSPFQYVPVPLMHALADPSNGKVFVNAYLNGSTSIYDPATGKSTVTARQGQVEDWAWDNNNTGKMYVGIYPYGRLSLWDPNAPATTTNPKELFTLVDSHHQNRPVAVVPAGNKVYVGTTPSYGEYGGALTVYDVPTGNFTVYRNVVADQTISSLLPVSTGVWAGSAIEGGQGTDPIAPEAHLVKVDPSTGAVLTDVVPVPGAASINELTIGPDGNLWGLADGVVFVADPTTGAVLRQIPVFSGRSGANDGALSWRDGYLYGVTDGRLFVVDSLGGVSTMLRDHGLNRLTQTPDGTYYTLLRPDGWTNPTNLGSYTPPADPCPTSDLRPTVWTGNIDSHVTNRHVEYGCTLTDVLPDAEADWPSHGAYVRAVDRKLRELETAGTIERWEGVLIRVAATRSDVGW